MQRVIAGRGLNPETLRRSLAAAEQLHRAGYSTLAWINGGLDASRKGDLPTVGDKDLRYGGIGGITEVCESAHTETMARYTDD